MKSNLLLFATLSLVFLACGSADQSAPSTSTDVTRNPAYAKGLKLIAESDCATCHQVDEKMTGPSYTDIAAKYAGATDAELTQVAQKIIKGGGGVWGEVPMTPHPSIPLENATAMVEYIVLLKK